nr:CapA family protein [Maliibacterium massiliense]
MRGAHRRRRRRIRYGRFCIFLVVLLALVAGAVIGCSALNRAPKEPDKPVSGDVLPPDEPDASPVATPTPDRTIKPVATATIGNTGDILVHSPILRESQQADGTYSFDPIFTHIAPYAKGVDYATINLELTLPGSKFSGYPAFRVPDSMIDSIMGAGFSMVTTANNHTNDSGASGMLRTSQVLQEKGLAYTGTRAERAQKNYLVQDINGIKVGMLNYTYGTYLADGTKSVNAIACNAETSALLNMFDYDHLDRFYEALATDIKNMRAEGAEALVMYIHWGTEYKLAPNSYQTQIAQKLSDLGVDVIVGCHPHVVQPAALITSEVSGKSTLCVYSMGNAVSNQRRERMDDIKSGHTEDGMFFTFTFTKYSDGSVAVTDADILPTWVNLYKEGGKQVYQIVPLDKSVPWEGTFNLEKTANGLALAQQSYERTMALVQEGLHQFDAYFAQAQQALQQKNEQLQNAA